MICRRAAYFIDSGMTEYYQKTCDWNSTSLKTKNLCNKLCKIHYTHTHTKKTFFMVYVETYDCYENIKIKLWSTVSILKPWHCRNF